MFFPRGGSAHVSRALALCLPAHGWDVTLVSGSAPGHGDARVFYHGLDVRPVDFAAGDAPMHPSYEDRPDAPDRVFAAVDDDAYERHVAAWSRALRGAGAADADVLHLHHLTPVHEAAARVAAAVPVVGHLHGTELLMLERIAEGPPPSWRFAQRWAERMRRWAGRCERLVVLTESQVERAAALLGADPERCVLCPNGFDPHLFSPREVDRASVWRRHLVEEPKGWRPGRDEGSVSYTAEQVAPLADAAVMLGVGRFTEVKRMGLLVRAFARAQRAARDPAALVLVGGYPGEWEGEHPFDAVAASGARDVFLAGWHDHEELPGLLRAADALVLPSVREQFGQVLVEAMACAVPPVAVDRYGPARIVRDGETGWLVEPDDEEGLADALVEVVNDEGERRRRGEAALRDARASYSWPALAGELSAIFEEARTHSAPGSVASS
jgi:glycosyltransferase involved in cell wall biosynthesis